MPTTIELSRFLASNEKALVGRDNGESYKKKLAAAGYDIDVLEKAADKTVLIIPAEILTMNKSFFLGLFELAVQHLGAAGFSQKFEIRASDYIVEKIPDYVQAALLRASQRDILGA